MSFGTSKDRAQAWGGTGNGSGYRPRASLLAIALLAAALACTGVAAQVRTTPTQPVRICVINSSPDLSPQAGVNISHYTLLSSTEANNMLEGLSMDMIDAVFGQILQWPYTIRYFANYGFNEVTYKTRVGIDCDVGVQSFFVTAARDVCLSSSCPAMPSSSVMKVDYDYINYACCVDFSYPYYTGGWSFMSKVSTGGNINYINVFFQRDIVQAIAVSIIVMFFMAHTIWLVERRLYGKSILLTNPKEGFSPYYLDGLKDGVWFSSMTLLNGVISSEKTIITPVGRLIATTWVLFGILMSAFVTAVIAASLTTAQLTTSAIMTVDDVAGKTVCTSSGFFDAFFDSSFPGVGVKKVLMDSIYDCFPMVSAGTVDAVFTIREEALGYFASGLGAGLIIAPIVVSQGYGMLWTEHWYYGDWVNEALLLWQQNVVATQPPYTDSINKWYYGDSHSITYGGAVQAAPRPWNWGLIGAAIALIGCYVLLQGFVMVAHFTMKRQEHEHGGSSKVHSTAGREKSFMQRAASAIAAPPDATAVDPNEEPTDLASMKRMASFAGSTRGGGSRGGDHSHRHMVAPAAQGAADAALLKDILKKVEVLMDEHNATTDSPHADMAVSVAETKPGKPRVSIQNERSKLPTEDVTEVKEFDD